MLADVAGLVVEVLDGDPAQSAERQAVADDEVRSLVVDVDLERPGVAGDEHRFADRLEMRPDGVEIEAAAGRRLEQEHRLVAEALVGMGDERGRLRWLGPAARAALAGASPRRWSSAPWKQAIQPLAAGVDDAGLAQDGEQARRPRDRLLGAVDRRRQDGLDIVLVLGPFDRDIGCLTDDRQDRSLDRLGDRAIGGPSPFPERVREVEPVEPTLAGDGLRHATHDLAGDDARVAPGAHQRAEADRRSDAVRRGVAGALALLERRLDGRQHVAAGVTVGDREDVEAVDLLDVGLEIRDRGAEGLEKPGPVAGSSRHQARSTGSGATTMPAAGGSLAGRSLGGGTLAGSYRSPPTWMVSRSTSRSRARRMV